MVDDLVPTPDIPRPEHPRPDLRRERWLSLNGEWSFATDPDDRGRRHGWHRVDAAALDRDEVLGARIVVPFAPGTEPSGVDRDGVSETVWYARELPPVALADGERLLLHVGAADHDAAVWVNGEHLVDHTGGYTPIDVDITDALTGERDVCVVRVHDRLRDLDRPRGKQFWQQEPAGVFYTGVTGIWQSVWLEVVSERCVRTVRLEPDLATASVDVEVTTSQAAVGSTLRISVTHAGHLLVRDELTILGPRIRRRVGLAEVDELRTETMMNFDGVAVWTPWTPELHDVTIEVVDGDAVHDRVHSYCGMRSVEVVGDQVLLNGTPVFQRLVLDQGYFPGGGYTAASDSDLRRDIELAKEMGFIGCRKHQKIEDPRWLYWADRLGFLVWAELPSAYRFSERTVAAATSTWQEVIARDRNHPCIIAWVPMNESWGTPGLLAGGEPDQVSYLRMMVHLTKALDRNRLVISNDGWEHVDTDVCSIHEYGGPDVIRDRFSSRQKALVPGRVRRSSYVRGVEDSGAPIIVSEFGGVRLADDDGWGFHTVHSDELVASMRAFIEAAVGSEVLQGFCWTQLTDVEQETNGLLTTDRRPKAPLADIRAAVMTSRHGGTEDPSSDPGATTWVPEQPV